MAEGETDSAADNKIHIFDRTKPEGPYSLNISLIYDQFILRDLITLSAELVKNSVENGTPFDQKACFFQVKLDGKAKWEVPNVKTDEGLWDLGSDPKGNLVFTFT